MVKTIYNYICSVCLAATAGNKREAMPAAIDWPADFDPAAGLKNWNLAQKSANFFLRLNSKIRKQ